MKENIKKQPLLVHITAVSTNNVIGLNNKLPWNIPEDLEFFRKKTLHHVLIMGRKTFESLGKPLPGRIHLVISKNKNLKLQGAEVFPGLQSAIGYAKEISPQKEIFITGGGQIYRQSINEVDKIYLTRIHKNFKGDAFYPEIPADQFRIINKVDKKGPPPFSFLTYERI